MNKIRVQGSGEMIVIGENWSPGRNFGSDSWQAENGKLVYISHTFWYTFFSPYEKHGIQRFIEEYYKVRFTVNVTTC